MAHYIGFKQNKPLQRGDQLYTSEYHVCGRQILTFKVDPLAVRVKKYYHNIGIQMNRKELTKISMII